MRTCESREKGLGRKSFLKSISVGSLGYSFCRRSTFLTTAIQPTWSSQKGMDRERQRHRDEDDKDEDIKETLRLVPKVVIMEKMQFYRLVFHLLLHHQHFFHVAILSS